jgi:hypothetical protein
LTDSDIFGAKSENAKTEFLRFVGIDFDPSFGSALLEQVGSELEQQSQLQEVSTLVASKTSFFCFVSA